MQGLKETAGADWRLICLRALIALMALSTANALRIVLWNWPMFAAAFPGVSSPGGKALAIVLPSMLLAALIGLWCRRRWALWMLAFATVATLIFDVAMRGPVLHLAAASISSLVLWYALWLNRSVFAPSAVTAGVQAPR